MALYLLNRLGQTVATLIIISMMVFALARLTGDPAPLLLPNEATEADRSFFREQFGLDKSVPEQYLVFVKNALRGNLGVSFRYREPAINVVGRGILPTLQLIGLAMGLAIVLGVPLGIAAANFRRPWASRLFEALSGIGQALPSFWVGLMLIIGLSIMLPIFPSSGYGKPANFVLPTLTLSLYSLSSIAVLTCANMRQALRSDFVHMEEVLGLPRRLIVLKHALRNASLPIVTYLALQFGLLFGGTVVTERVFAWPGLGETIVDAILGRDYPVIQAAVLLIAVFFIIVNIAADIVGMLLDPRVRT